MSLSENQAPEIRLSFTDDAVLKQRRQMLIALTLLLVAARSWRQASPAVFKPASSRRGQPARQAVQVGARQAEPDDGIVRHQLGHLLEFSDSVAVGHGQVPWIRSSGTSTRLTPLKLNRSSTL